jgi:2,3-bisphosphoglycerate-independent phosphoglycerate mutase
MKYVIIIPDGAADHPLEELGGKTPFEAAHIPHADRISQEGRLGTVVTTPSGFACGSDVCSLCLLGYDPARYHKGRAPLEATALGIDLQPSDWVFRVNLITVDDGRIRDHSAGHISSQEGAQLLRDLGKRVDLPDMQLHPGVSYRNIMLDRSGTRDYSGLRTTPPHDVPGESMRKHLPKGSEHAGILQHLIAESEVLFKEHEVNRTRRELGEQPATHVWPWGQGRRPELESFQKRFGLRGAMITAVDLLAGIAAYLGWDRLDVPGQTSYHDTDYAAAGRAAIEALADYDLVCVHVEAPDEAAHAADAQTKVAAIEAIDAHIVGPICEHLRRHVAEHRVLYIPDHFTACATRKHDPTPVPFAARGHRMYGVVPRSLSETNAQGSDLHIAFGHELMEYFLFSGL